MLHLTAVVPSAEPMVHETLCGRGESPEDAYMHIIVDDVGKLSSIRLLYSVESACDDIEQIYIFMLDTYYCQTDFSLLSFIYGITISTV